MKAERRTEYVTRDTILRLLSDEEIARVVGILSAHRAAAAVRSDAS